MELTCFFSSSTWRHQCTRIDLSISMGIKWSARRTGLMPHSSSSISVCRKVRRDRKTYQVARVGRPIDSKLFPKPLTWSILRSYQVSPSSSTPPMLDGSAVTKQPPLLSSSSPQCIWGIPSNACTDLSNQWWLIWWNMSEVRRARKQTVGWVHILLVGLWVCSGLTNTYSTLKLRRDTQWLSNSECHSIIFIRMFYSSNW